MIRIGFIGTGGISGAHLNCLKTRKDVRVVGLCDINIDAAKNRQKVFGGDIFTDYKDMLARVKLDAVYICTPPTVRRELLLACADKGLPIFCEKPVEHSALKAARIAADLKRRKAKVQIGYVFRSMPVIEKLKQAMHSDKLHIIQSFYGCPMSLDMTFPAWFFDKAISGGGLIDQATHNLDLLRHLFGEVKTIKGLAHNPLHRVKPGYTIDETIGLVFMFESGVVASHLHTWVCDSWRNEIFISGERSFYRLNPGDGKLVVESTRENMDRDSGKLLVGAGSGPAVFDQGPSSVYAYENSRFIDMVKSDDWSSNPSDYDDGLKTLQLTLACDRAVTKGLRLLKRRPACVS